MTCDHDLDVEYRSPSDAHIASIDDRDDAAAVTIVLPCPDCEETVEAAAVAEQVAETDRPLLLDDSGDGYA